MPEIPADVITCPDCHAELPWESQFCWLCGARVSAAARAQAPSVALIPAEIRAAGVSSAGPADEPGEPKIVGLSGGKTPFNPAPLILLVVIVTVLLGVWLESPLSAMFLAVILIPSLLVTFAKSWSRTMQSRRAAAHGIRGGTARALQVAPMTAGEEVGTFFGVLLRTIFVVISLLAIGAVIAMAFLIAALSSCIHQCR